MGERSNIFVRIREKERSSDKNYKHETFFGLYYQWCYGERMISRLRSAINFVENNIGGCRGEWAVSDEQISKFKRYLAINFDMQDIVEPVDLIPNAIERVNQGYDNAKADIFAQYENHGYIYIDITLDDPDKKFGVYKGKLYDIPNEFFWMSRDRMTQLANENNNAFMFNDARTSKERYVYTLLNNPEISSLLSPTAKQLLDMATAMMEKTVKYRPLFESDHPNHHIHTWDAGYYQLKNLWKEYLPEEFKRFRDMFKQFENELRPLVYELGFLRK